MKKQKGFYLIELIIVVGIIGVLAAFVIPNYLRYEEKTKQVEVTAIFEDFKGQWSSEKQLEEIQLTFTPVYYKVTPMKDLKCNTLIQIEAKNNGFGDDVWQILRQEEDSTIKLVHVQDPFK